MKRSQILKAVNLYNLNFRKEDFFFFSFRYLIGRITCKTDLREPKEVRYFSVIFS